MQSPFDWRWLAACMVLLIALGAKADLAEQDTQIEIAVQADKADAQRAAMVAMRGGYE